MSDQDPKGHEPAFTPIDQQNVNNAETVNGKIWKSEIL